MGNLFKSKHEAWVRLSEGIGGEIEAGSFMKTEKVRLPYKHFIITLDTYTVSSGTATIPFTRIQMPFVNPSNFTFKVNNEGFMSFVGKAFGMKDINIGDDELDDRFVFKGNDEMRISSIFRDHELKQLLIHETKVHLQIKNKTGFCETHVELGEGILYFEIGGYLKDLNHLKNLFDIFTRLADLLIELNITTEEIPKTKISK